VSRRTVLLVYRGGGVPPVRRQRMVPPVRVCLAGRPRQRPQERLHIDASRGCAHPARGAYARPSEAPSGARLRFQSRGCRLPAPPPPGCHRPCSTGAKTRPQPPRNRTPAASVRPGTPRMSLPDTASAHPRAAAARLGTACPESADRGAALQGGAVAAGGPFTSGDRHTRFMRFRPGTARRVCPPTTRTSAAPTGFPPASWRALRAVCELPCLLRFSGPVSPPAVRGWA